MHDADTFIRAERPIDSGAIRYVHEAAFGRRDEADIVHRIRKTEGFIPSLSLVADSDGFIIGHAMLGVLAPGVAAMAAYRASLPIVSEMCSISSAAAAPLTSETLFCAKCNYACACPVIAFEGAGL